MGYTEPWYSVRGVEAPVGGSMGYIARFLRDGDRVFLTYSTTGRGNERVNESLGLLDMTPYGRGEAWEDRPRGLARGAQPLLVLALAPWCLRRYDLQRPCDHTRAMPRPVANIVRASVCVTLRW